MKKLVICSVLSFLVGALMFSGNPWVRSIAAWANESGEISLTGLAKAVVVVNKNVSTLEKRVALSNDAIIKLQSELSSVKQELATARTIQAQQHQAILTLHERLSALDGRSGSLRLTQRKPPAKNRVKNAV